MGNKRNRNLAISFCPGRDLNFWPLGFLSSIQTNRLSWTLTERHIKKVLRIVLKNNYWPGCVPFCFRSSTPGNCPIWSIRCILSTSSRVFADAMAAWNWNIGALHIITLTDIIKCTSKFSALAVFKIIHFFKKSLIYIYRKSLNLKITLRTLHQCISNFLMLLTGNC